MYSAASNVCRFRASFTSCNFMPVIFIAPYYSNKTTIQARIKLELDIISLKNAKKNPKHAKTTNDEQQHKIKKTCFQLLQLDSLKLLILSIPRPRPVIRFIRFFKLIDFLC